MKAKILLTPIYIKTIYPLNIGKIKAKGVLTIKIITIIYSMIKAYSRFNRDPMKNYNNNRDRILYLFSNRKMEIYMSRTKWKIQNKI